MNIKEVGLNCFIYTNKNRGWGATAKGEKRKRLLVAVKKIYTHTRRDKKTAEEKLYKGTLFDGWRESLERIYTHTKEKKS